MKVLFITLCALGSVLANCPSPLNCSKCTFESFFFWDKSDTDKLLNRSVLTNGNPKLLDKLFVGFADPYFDFNLPNPTIKPNCQTAFSCAWTSSNYSGFAVYDDDYNMVDVKMIPGASWDGDRYNFIIPLDIYCDPTNGGYTSHNRTIAYGSCFMAFPFPSFDEEFSNTV